MHPSELHVRTYDPKPPLQLSHPRARGGGQMRTAVSESPLLPPPLCDAEFVVLAPDMVSTTCVLAILWVLEPSAVGDKLPHDAAAVLDPPSLFIMEDGPGGYVITALAIVELRLARADLKGPAMKSAT